MLDISRYNIHGALDLNKVWNADAASTCPAIYSSVVRSHGSTECHYCAVINEDHLPFWPQVCLGMEY